jgi:hypothetical protein
MTPRCSRAALSGMLLLASCGGGTPSEPPPPPPLPAVGSIHFISGDGQTDTAGAFIPVVIEVRDVNGDPSPGRTIVLTPAGSEPPLWFEIVGGGEAETDSLGRLALRWQIFGHTGTRHLIAAVLGAAVVGKDSIVATVLPASPSNVEYAETTVSRLLGQPADLATNITGVTDVWGNPVAVQTVSVEAPPPLSVSGEATVVSQEEVDTAVTLTINGVAFLQRVIVLRDVHEFLGAVGDWTCSSDPGAPWVDTPGQPWTGQYLQTQVGHFTVDSITRYGDYSAAWTFHLTTTLHQTLDDGETRDVGPYYERRYLLYQFVGGFLFPYGPEMDQTASNPVRYVAQVVEDCTSWQGPSANQPLTVTLSH